MAINVPGLISVIVFYLIILVIGIIAGRKTAKSGTTQEMLVADRSMNLVVAFFTLAASHIGGGYINGTAEIMASSGAVWAQAPVAYCISFIINGIFFGPKMRRAEYITMFDPFQIKLGKRVGALMCVPQFLGDLFWTASILAALGSTISIILDADEIVSIVISAIVAIFYTFLGGLWSVAYTDVVQLLCIAIGLVIAAPFSLIHDAVDIERVVDTWQGNLQPNQIGYYIDVYCLLLFGGIPWQAYYQRTLACKSPESARLASFLASIACFLFAIPAAIMGIAGASANWNETNYQGLIPIPQDKMSYILPLTLQHLCPLPVAIIGMGAISAAVMSSADSSILSTASVFASNIYRELFRKHASDREILWVLRISIIVTGTLATTIAITAKSVYGLYVLCSDLMYVILFPQLVAIMYFDVTNAYGSITGYVIGFLIRILGGEPLIKIPALVKFPFYDSEFGQGFPFRTFAMLLSFIAIIGISKLFEYLFLSGKIPIKYDIFLCSSPNFRNRLKMFKSTQEMKRDMREYVEMKKISSFKGEHVIL
ncbi:hypothetical protein LOTGIDRAFT_181262 [Lottia gigantea]|uniref:Uncharacterized protein n=1 Tax=Lottia gigantea TaxID=225164 RepID=V4B4L3_LOTGI|nr:hypothetical protein LOTGIDRAFT_181262 [Lottia gigantea]ESP05418.1 hypothetical protein LOTGIDRAFT_181262 [Lottia gigantea]